MMTSEVTFDHRTPAPENLFIRQKLSEHLKIQHTVCSVLSTSDMATKITQITLLISQWSATQGACYILTGVAGVARPAGATAAVVPPTTPRRAKPVTPVNIKLSVARASVGFRRWWHTHVVSAAVAAPHAPLGEGRPSSRQQQQGRTALAPGRR